jgi:hypothetical protein
MPRVIITEGAAVGLERCRAFLQDKNAQAAKRAGQWGLRRSGTENQHKP